MNIYTKTGDNGTTSLTKYSNVSKSDDRIQLLGNIDELTSNLGLVKASASDRYIIEEIERIQKNLMTIMAGISDSDNHIYELNENEVIHLEKEINLIEQSFERKKEFILPGSTTHSAQIDITRTIARRSERWLSLVDRKFKSDQGARKYMNRLADYLYMLARKTDYLNQNKKESLVTKPLEGLTKVSSNMTNDEIVMAVLERLGLNLAPKKEKVNLSDAKKLIEKVEEYCISKGINAVIAVCGADGNPIAVHVMDDSFLASYDIAVKKAYTSVAVKMSTKELGKLSLPGETFYGIDKADNGRMIIFGGGVPLVVDNKIIGGLGISGGSAEQDAELADYGLSILHEII